ncbi:MAG: hypothetical protein WCP14_04050 [bacterium]
MTFLYQILIGLALFGVGFVLTIYTKKITYFFGVQDWMIKYLGPGGGFVFYILLGLVSFLFGFLFIFGFMNSFF